MASRIVTGKLERADRTPWAGATIWFELIPGSYTADTQYPRNRIATLTNPEGEFQQELWTNAEGVIPCKYRCTYPSGESFEFSLPAGASPAPISALRVLGNPTPEPPETIPLALVDELIETQTAELRPFYIHLGAGASP